VVYLGYMFPTSEKYQEMIELEAKIYEVSVEKMLEIIIDAWMESRIK
jgi:hypothetical protein